jgi:hypothetical protein
MTVKYSEHSCASEICRFAGLPSGIRYQREVHNSFTTTISKVTMLATYCICILIFLCSDLLFISGSNRYKLYKLILSIQVNLPCRLGRGSESDRSPLCSPSRCLERMLHWRCSMNAVNLRPFGKWRPCFVNFAPVCAVSSNPAFPVCTRISHGD